MLFMKSSKIVQDDFVFSTTATGIDNPTDEFLLELFDYSPDLSCDGIPKKVIKNFDELIEFLKPLIRFWIMIILKNA